MVIEVLREEIAAGTLRVFVAAVGVFALAGQTEHAIEIPAPALANRVAFYGLGADDDPVDAILREHYHRLAGKDQSAPERDVAVGQRIVRQPLSWQEIDPKERGRITGGLDDAITIERRQPL